jgi:hypothetical protein
MTKPDLLELERDVENARERFADSLARVRSPAAFEDFKESLVSQAREMRDELIDRTREATQDTISHLLTEVKERAAANPAAALTIGAGLLWRLVRRPPIASLLVGVGAISLFNTPSGQNDARGTFVKSLPGGEALKTPLSWPRKERKNGVSRPKLPSGKHYLIFPKRRLAQQVELRTLQVGSSATRP